MERCRSIALVLLLVSSTMVVGAQDSDFDGIDDHLDICPYAHGNATQAEGLGCPDSDGDGWADFQNATSGDWENSTQDYHVSIGGSAQAVAWAVDGMSYAAGGTGNTVDSFDVAGQYLGTLLAGALDINDLHYSPDGTKLAVAMDDGLLSVIDPVNGNVIHNLTISSEYDFYCVRFSNDGSLMYAGSGDTKVRAIHTSNWTEAGTYESDWGVYDIALTPDDSQFAIATGHQVNIVYAGNLSDKSNLSGFNDYVVTVDIDLTGRYLGVGSYNNWAYIYDFVNLSSETYHNIGRDVRDVEFTPDSSVMLVVSNNGDADAIEVGTWVHLGDFGSFGSSNQNRGARDLAIHPDGEMALVAMRRGRVSIHVLDDGYLWVKGGHLPYTMKSTWRSDWPQDGRLLNTENMSRDFSTIDICSGSGTVHASVEGASRSYTSELANHSDSGLLDCLTSNRQVLELPVGRYPGALVIKKGGEVESCINSLGGGLTTAQVRWMLSASARNVLAGGVGELPGLDLASVAPNSDQDALREWSDLSSACPDDEIVFVSDWENKTLIPMLHDTLFCGSCASKDFIYAHSNDRARVQFEWPNEIRNGITGPAGDSGIGLLELQYALDNPTGMMLVPLLDNLTHGVGDALAAGQTIVQPDYNSSTNGTWPLQSDFRLMIADEDLEDKRNFLEWFLSSSGMFSWEQSGFIRMDLWHQVLSWDMLGVDARWMLPDDDGDGIWNGEDDCPDTVDGETVNLVGCAETQLDDDDDGINNALDDCDDEHGNATQSPFVGCLDVDGDGYADVDDAFPAIPSQWRDSDSDGYGDEPSGYEADACASMNGNSSADRFGCTDSDGDGYSDADEFWEVEDGADAFPLDPTQWIDSDGDGHGDNYTYSGADDSRSDEAGDAFSNDPSQWRDADGDGFGDNNSGTDGDDCPDIAGSSVRNDTYGCIDSDGDGFADSIDDMPDEGSQWWDRDQDGYGDNLAGSRADYCPDTTPEERDDVNAEGCGPSERDTDSDGIVDSRDECLNTSPFKVTQVDETGCAPYEKDSDGDGVSDEDDWSPLDGNQTADSDGDGFGDNSLVFGGDDCPQQAGTSSGDRTGCLDSDSDGFSDPTSDWTIDDGADWRSQDPTQWRDSDGDGYGDNWGDSTWNETRDNGWPGVFIPGASKADACPTVAYEFAQSDGCPPDEGADSKGEDDQQELGQESSSGGLSGMMIGVIAGGGVVVLTLVGAILMLLRRPDGAAAPVEEMVEEEVEQDSGVVDGHVPGWQQLPQGGEYLPPDEHGTVWYREPSGVHWYQNSDESWTRWQ